MSSENKVVFATRAEEVGNRVFDYFAQPTEAFYSRLLKHKAAVLVGGRGTGKTMILKSMTFEYKINGRSVAESQKIWDEENFLGCYIRADTNIVSSFKGRGIFQEEWDDLFAHYFNLRVIQQIVKTLELIIYNEIIDSSILNVFIQRYYEIIGVDFENQNIHELKNNIRLKMDELVRYINNPKKAPNPELINNETLVFECCQYLYDSIKSFKKTWFILIDEYENLTITQQRIVNTLIKMNQPPVIFKIAMRPGGWWTKETLAHTELLEDTADFDMIDYHNDFTDLDYKDLIIRALEKNLSLIGIKDPIYQDVTKLLPDISPEEEAILIRDKSKRDPEIDKKIEEFIKEYTIDDEEIKELKKKLIISEDPLRTRFHLVLLDRRKTPKQIKDSIVNNQKSYTESYTHSRIGTLFLFCSEYRVKKKYCGFETYLLLSSKIMRNFMSLFSRVWEISSDEEFSIDAPRPFSIESQSKAAYDISRNKVSEIESYPSGMKLSSFINQLGRIFEQLNKDNRQSQPERNHFSILGDISEKADELKRSALLHSIIQEIPATKIKSSSQIRGSDYVLNRIYSPYYNISYRKMHKLEFSSPDFESLTLGDDEKKKALSSKILRKNLKDVNLSENNIQQLDLFNSFLQEE